MVQLQVEKLMQEAVFQQQESSLFCPGAEDSAIHTNRVVPDANLQYGITWSRGFDAKCCNLFYQTRIKSLDK